MHTSSPRQLFIPLYNLNSILEMQTETQEDKNHLPKNTKLNKIQHLLNLGCLAIQIIIFCSISFHLHIKSIFIRNDNLFHNKQSHLCVVPAVLLRILSLLSTVTFEDYIKFFKSLKKTLLDKNILECCFSVYFLLLFGQE